MNISSQVLNEEQFFLLNGQKLSGISNVSLSYSNSLENSPVLGDASFGFLLSGPISASVELNRLLVGADPLLNYSGDVSFSGAFNYGDRSYSFESGYLSSYSMTCGVGQAPDVAARISIFCELKTGQLISSEQVLDESIFVAGPKSISVSGLDFEANRVRQFDYSIEISRQPIYSLEGGKSAQSVNLILPINVSAGIEMDASNSNMRPSYSFVDSNFENDVNILIKDRSLANTIFNVSVPNAELINESISASADGQPVKTIQLAGFFS